MARYPKQDDPGGKNVIPSVTEIIGDCTDKSGALTQWAANMCKEWILENIEHEPNSDKGNYTGNYYYVAEQDLDLMRFNFKTVSQKALDIGSDVHSAIEMYLQNNLYVVSTKEAENAFDAFLSWAKEHNLKPNALEMTVYGETNGNPWAGTLDFFGEFDGKLYVIDWKSSAPANKKTGKGIRKDMRIQVAAYRWAVEQPSAIIPFDTNPCDGCGVLRLDKETGLPDFVDTSKSYEQDLKIFNRMVDLYFERHPIIRKRARG